MAPGAAEAEANEPVPFTLRFSSKGVIWDPETTAGNGITREEGVCGALTVANPSDPRQG